jgi:hypothetical protein
MNSVKITGQEMRETMTLIISEGLSMSWKHSQFIHFQNPENYDIFMNEDLLSENKD